MRLRRLTRVLVFIFLGGLTLPGSHCHHHHGTATKNGSPGDPAPPATSAPPVKHEGMTWTPAMYPPCSGTGIPSGPHPMNATETAMGNAINAYRTSLGLTAIPLASVAGEGVAQWHAADMASNDYVGLVGSDGEDVLHRLVCSGNSASVPGPGGTVAAGQSSDGNATLTALQADPSANAVLTLPGPFTVSTLCVGYNNGFWMIIVH